MRFAFVLAAALFTSAVASAQEAETDSTWQPTAQESVRVNGYVKRDGTYVQPHRRSTSDTSFENNWSTAGNTNPYTGVKGHKRSRR